MSIIFSDDNVKHIVTLFKIARRILESGIDYELDEIKQVLDSLESYEAQIRELRHSVYRVYQNKVYANLIKDK